MSGKKVLSTDEDGYRTKKNMSFAFLRCMGVSVLECAGKFPENAALKKELGEKERESVRVTELYTHHQGT